MTYLADPKLRRPAVLAAIAVQAALIWALASGLAGKAVRGVSDRLQVISIPAALPPASPTPPPAPSPSPEPRRAGGAAPELAGAAGRKAEATPIVAHRPSIVLASPPPVVTAPTPGAGARASSAAALAGSGPGAGGEGAGSGGDGAGGAGGGTGAGAGAGVAGARRVAGGLRDSDYPQAAARTRASGTVSIRIRVGSDGRVSGCEVSRSSGNAALDETTCRLVRKRFRYRPAFDAGGRPVESFEATEFTWGPRM